MRLTQIKLAGFKSFVEATSFAVPSQLVGVVGPNGCGKSNIIDAVRWVLGESKASELRGESMQDVIFNGSTTRKPASRASVELVFDNAQARAGGHWNQFSEIAVKRVLTRDGTSTYYINQQVVRRRDVQDIFLGTGLGPRAYAIIGQGMIARLIEARPEELRVFLEEAAGVSKYKERRRETANRLQDTRDNLTRVEDIVRELNNNIETLQQQAEIARQYRDYDETRQLKQLFLWLIRWQNALLEQQRHQMEALRLQTELESLNAQSVRAQTEAVLLRERHHAAQQTVDAAQQLHQVKSNEVSRIESDIRVFNESRQRLNQRIAELAAQRQDWQRRVDDARRTLEALHDEKQTVEETIEEARYRHEEADLQLEPAQAVWEQSRQRAEDARRRHGDSQQTVARLGLQRDAVRRALEQLETKAARLQAERSLLQPVHPEVAAALQTSRQQLERQLAVVEDACLAADVALAELKPALQTAQQAARQDQQRLTTVEARFEALRQIQNKLAANDRLRPWLEKHGLAERPRLLARLRVEPGWEKAVEAVLGDQLAAREVDSLDGLRHAVADLPGGAVAFLDSKATLPSVATVSRPDALTGLVRSDDPTLQRLLNHWLSGFFVCDSLGQALDRRSDLAAGDCLVTPQGHRVRREALLIYADRDESAGMLARQRELDDLERESRALALLASESGQAVTSLQTRLLQAEQAQQTSRQQRDVLRGQVHDLQIRLLKADEQRERFQQSIDRLALDLSLLEDERAEQLAALETIDAEQDHAETERQAAAVTAESSQANAQQAERALRDREALVREAERQLREAEFEARALATRQEGAERDLAMADAQTAQLDAAQIAATTELAVCESTDLQDMLQQGLAARLLAEERLSDARRQADELAEALRLADEAERHAERTSLPVRDALQNATLQEQAARLTVEQFDEHLSNSLVDRQVLAAQLEALPVRPNPAALQTEVTQLTNKINALGAVNLAALQALEAAGERKTFLDHQIADLQEAMSTLEDAIQRIDKETRSLLQGTFDTVNGHFGRLFPLLFGGGEARLVMSGEQVLDAGVQVFAQPPGKKNGTIHLLSGGEKALTATALVFAIFELNPAPFCLLDEVDAPLDDANTERFCSLVRKMSQQTQFLFISHNKIAMEMAEQLIGVTMQEKGVSRIVAVDLDTAEKMALETV
ncbi:MAG: chromosome segregation protein SMC [Burkholderiaceae bacterium]